MFDHVPPEAPEDDREFVNWLAGRSQAEQEQYGRAHFHILLHAAAQPRHVSGNACIKLCFFVDQCRKSSCPSLKELAYSPYICSKLFDFYIEGTERNQHRSMRQILELTATIISTNPEADLASECKATVLHKAVGIIAHNAAQPLAKPAFKALECFMAKKAISAIEITSCYQKSYKSVSPRDMDALVALVFGWFKLPDVASSAGKFLVTYWQAIKRRDPITYSEVSLELHSRPVQGHPPQDGNWHEWIRSGLFSNPDCMESIKNYLLPSFFKLDRSGSLEFIEMFMSETVNDPCQDEVNTDILLFLAALEVGTKLGLVVHQDSTTKSSKNSIVLHEKLIGQLLCHWSGTVRSNAFSVLISTNMSTTPFSASQLDLLKDNLPFMHSDTDARFRNEVLSNTKHMIERIRDSNAVLSRTAASEERHGRAYPDSIRASTPEVLAMQRQFLEWYRLFLAGEFVVTASYQRHITALKAFQILVAAGLKSKHRIIDEGELSVASYFSSAMIRLLLDLLADPFEDVRATATAILKLAPLESFAPRSSSIQAVTIDSTYEPRLVTDLLSRLERSSQQTGRAALADAVAHANELLYSFRSPTLRIQTISDTLSKLFQLVEAAESNLVEAVATASIHEQFAAMRTIWQLVDTEVLTHGLRHLAEMQVKMLDCCNRIWTVVRVILCDDSPEGHCLPDNPNLDSKKILSYCFRAVHESSQLVNCIIAKGTIKETDGATLLSESDFAAAGDLTYTQLSSLRHRGAFSTVSSTFVACCKYSLIYDSSNVLLGKWCDGAFACIMDQASTTRRSAGIPQLIVGVLSANAQTPNLEEVMMKLMNIARQPVVSSEDETNVPQVHATNCIREIFKSTLLGRAADRYLSDNLVIATDNLNSDKQVWPHQEHALADKYSWAIRNCGLLLLRSLIDCLFGTSESKEVMQEGWDGRSIKINYNNYPSLPALLLKLIDNRGSARVGLERKAEMSIFPALDIVRRAGPPPSLRDNIFEAVKEHLGSGVWHIREVAARTMETLLLEGGWQQKVVQLIHWASTTNSPNRAHGVLLTVEAIMGRSNMDEIKTILVHLDVMAYSISGSNIAGTCHGLGSYSYEGVVAAILKTLWAAKRQGLSIMRELEVLYHHRLVAQDVIANSLTTLRTLHAPSQALQRRAIILKTMLIGALEDRIQDLMPLVEYVGTDSDTALAFIEDIQQTWPSSGAIAVQEHIQLDALFGVIIAQSSNSQVQEAAWKARSSLIMSSERRNLCVTDFIASDTAVSQWSKAIVALTTIGREWHTATRTTRLALDLREWCVILADGIRPEEDLHTRQACAQSILGFYRFLEPTETRPAPSIAELPLLEVLYDILNDDDEDIRHLAAGATVKLFGRRYVAGKAQALLLEYLSTVFDQEQDFVSLADERIRTELLLTPFSTLLRDLLVDDEALFIEEEQNLYIDPVSELMRWISLMKYKTGSLWDTLADHLHSTILQCLQETSSSAIARDGPYGPVSKPSVFTLFSRITNIAEALLQRYAHQIDTGHHVLRTKQLQEELEAAVDSFVVEGKRLDFHPYLLGTLSESKQHLTVTYHSPSPIN